MSKIGDSNHSHKITNNMEEGDTTTNSTVEAAVIMIIRPLNRGPTEGMDRRMVNNKALLIIKINMEQMQPIVEMVVVEKGHAVADIVDIFLF